MQKIIFSNWEAYYVPFSTIPSGVEWVKFNVGQYGYYRVNYPDDDWKRFALLLQENMVSSRK